MSLSLSIESPPDQLRATALSLLLGDLAEAERQQQVAHLLADQPAEQWQGLLVAWGGDDLVGVIWGQDIGGGAWHIWPPRATGDEPERVADQLLTQMIALAQQRGVTLLQTLLPTERDDDGERLARAGFQRLADLKYLACFAKDFPTEELESELTFRVVTPADETLLTEVIAATYEQTCDLPELNGMRSAAEVIAEYRSAPQYDPALWFLAEHEGMPTGCLILNDHRDLRQLELVYMGIVPGKRGLGGGECCVYFALWQAYLRKCEHVMLAVSATNEPALHIYSEAGFVRWQRRQTWVRFLREEKNSAISKP